MKLRSLLLAGLELLLAVGAVDDERVFVLVLDQAGAHELLHHVSSQLAGLGIFLELHDLLLQHVDFIIFGLLLQFLLLLVLLLLLDLLLGAAALARGLQHVGGHAFGDYRNDKWG